MSEYKQAPLTGKAFRLSKQTKRLLALMPFKDEHQRGEYRRAMIAAEYAAKQVVKSAVKRDGKTATVQG